MKMEELRFPLADSLRASPAPVRHFLTQAMEDFASRSVVTEPKDPGQLPGLIFGIQTRREFCYLSNGRVQCYRASAEKWIERWVSEGKPVHYYLDIGGGYHASLTPGVEDISFDVGLGELLMLLQIHRFNQRVRAIYAQGVRFTLVIDNLCANLINDIAVAQTSAYCVRLRDLIESLKLSAEVDLLVESELFSVDQFNQLLAKAPPVSSTATVTQKEHETVERFLGRACDVAEAIERTARYRDITQISGQLIGAKVDGLRMTQRATPDTICFRSYPGGDSRMQSGQIALKITGDDSVLPFLLTSHNVHEYDYYRIASAGISPARLESVICAEPATIPLAVME